MMSLSVCVFSLYLCILLLSFVQAFRVAGSVWGGGEGRRDRERKRRGRGRQRLTD